MPSTVIAGSRYRGSVKLEEGDFYSIGEAQALVEFYISEPKTRFTIGIEPGGLSLTGDTISFTIYISSKYTGSGVARIYIVDWPGDVTELMRNLSKYIVANPLENPITIIPLTTSDMIQSQEFSTTDDLNVTYEFLSEDREIIKDGLKLQSPLLK
jgi:hypothetical protein